MKRKKTSEKKVLKYSKNSFVLSFILGLAIVSGFYGIYSLKFKTQFLPNTKVFGVSISDMNVDEASKTLHSRLDHLNFKIIEDEHVLYTVKSEKIHLRKDYAPFLRRMLSNQNPALWGVKTLSLTQASNDSEINDENIKLSINEDALNQMQSQIKNDLNSNRTYPQDAKIDFQDGKYKLIKEVEGNAINFDKLQKKIKNNIYNSNDKIIITKNDYEQPKILSDSPKIQKNFQQIKKIQESKITYQVANLSTINVPNETIISWINYDGNEVTLKTQNIYNYILNINGNYTTVGATRNFTTSDGKVIQVKGGTYGRQILINNDATKFKNALMQGGETKIEATTIGQGQNEPNVDNIGSTYVEVSKEKQHEWVYVDGKLFLQSDIVTGKPNKTNNTPTGTFVIWDKKSPSVLKGTNDDGTPYTSPVTYWMPIDYTGVGLHDSPWQPKYGGDWYMQHGSHGCINNPPEIIAKFYSVLQIGTPVIIY